jgi:hypothetical protein
MTTEKRENGVQCTARIFTTGDKGVIVFSDGDLELMAMRRAYRQCVWSSAPLNVSGPSRRTLLHGRAHDHYMAVMKLMERTSCPLLGTAYEKRDGLGLGMHVMPVQGLEKLASIYHRT